jgi:hypothetical protein
MALRTDKGAKNKVVKATYDLGITLLGVGIPILFINPIAGLGSFLAGGATLAYSWRTEAKMKEKKKGK